MLELFPIGVRTGWPLAGIGIGFVFLGMALSFIQVPSSIKSGFVAHEAAEEVEGLLEDAIALLAELVGLEELMLRYIAFLWMQEEQKNVGWEREKRIGRESVQEFI